MCKKNVIKRLLIGPIAILILLICGFYVYTLNYYKAQNTAKETVAQSNHYAVKDGSMIIFYPKFRDKDKTAIIFYPGAKVEYIAYAPILKKLADRGITTVLLKMPFNLAIFDTNAADKVYKKLPNIKNWYISGHSLGGAMASKYSAENESRLKGIILLGAYRIKKTTLRTLIVYGSNDKILNKTKLDKTSKILEINGGNHADFGNYGDQKGDGKATITRESQQNQTVEAILNFIDEQKK
ncbi:MULTISPECIES: alpha/beta hydrolase [Clostridium]|uniref:alpha/beta hydrolase n=1 Tax=Clostridium TaxID=1485 RepID=UPI000826CCD8|nr:MULTISPECIES: alpha/beta hydrolase [Clostridium]PJI07806.1 alpha/beta hydrolase [Clostridium sp. CT7]